MLEPDNDRLNMPLVSITVHNYNYGRYLRECLDSVFAQTYPRIEVCFSDNASEDDSWEIALDYNCRYPGIMNISRLRRNFGAEANNENCRTNVRGKYVITMCSDDVMAPDFVKRCVAVLEIHHQCAYAMVHRTIINERNEREEEEPFYKQSCIIRGKEQAAVYMMAAVNPSMSQVMYRVTSLHGNVPIGTLTSRWYGARLMDFNLCRNNDMAYIHEALLLHRIHAASDSTKGAEDLLEVIAPFVLQHQLAEIASVSLMEKAAARLPAAICKLGDLASRYCVRFLLQDREDVARRYFHLAAAIRPEISEEPTYMQIQAYWSSHGSERKRILEELRTTSNLAQRTCSYEPPPDSQAIDWEAIGRSLPWARS